MRVNAIFDAIEYQEDKLRSQGGIYRGDNKWWERLAFDCSGMRLYVRIKHPYESGELKKHCKGCGHVLKPVISKTYNDEGKSWIEQRVCKCGDSREMWRFDGYKWYIIG